LDSGVSTVPPLKRIQLLPGWAMQDAEGGTWYNSLEHSWRDLSTPTEIGPGCSVYLADRPAHLMLICFPGENVVSKLLPPAPAQFFSFDRYTSPLGGNPEEPPTWLYTVYGYLLGDQAVISRYYATKDLETLVLPRPVSFPW
jgi:hypothetical protein